MRISRFQGGAPQQVGVLATEIEADLAAAAEYAEAHGAFGDFVRAHYGHGNGAAVSDSSGPPAPLVG